LLRRGRIDPHEARSRGVEGVHEAGARPLEPGVHARYQAARGSLPRGFVGLDIDGRDVRHVGVRPEIPPRGEVAPRHLPRDLDLAPNQRRLSLRSRQLLNPPVARAAELALPPPPIVTPEPPCSPSLTKLTVSRVTLQPWDDFPGAGVAEGRSDDPLVPSVAQGDERRSEERRVGKECRSVWGEQR